MNELSFFLAMGVILTPGLAAAVLYFTLDTYYKETR